MVVDVDKIKNSYLSNMNELYNSETYFVESCTKFPTKYSLEYQIMDDSLRIFFEENNKLILCDQMVKYCDKDSKRKIRLYDISNEIYQPDLPEVTNYIVMDTWKKIEW